MNADRTDNRETAKAATTDKEVCLVMIIFCEVDTDLKIPMTPEAYRQLLLDMFG